MSAAWQSTKLVSSTVQCHRISSLQSTYCDASSEHLYNKSKSCISNIHFATVAMSAAISSNTGSPFWSHPNVSNPLATSPVLQLSPLDLTKLRHLYRVPSSSLQCTSLIVYARIVALLVFARVLCSPVAPLRLLVELCGSVLVNHTLNQFSF